MTDYTSEQLAEYNGKRVTVVQNLAEPNEKGESAIEVEGQVQVGNQLGLLIKPKGQVQFKLIPISEIEEVSLAKESSKKLKRSELKPVTIGQARRHLLERHGVTLEWVNGVDEEQALAYHNTLDHVELDLGHVHVEKADETDDASSE